MNALAVSGQSQKRLLEFNLAETRRGGLREGTENETSRKKEKKKKKEAWLKSDARRWEIDEWLREKMFEGAFASLWPQMRSCLFCPQMSLLLCKHCCALLSTVSHSLSCPLLFAYRQHSDEISNIARSVHTASLLACDYRLTARRYFHLLNSDLHSPCVNREQRPLPQTGCQAVIGLCRTQLSLILIFLIGRSFEIIFV